VLEAARSGVCRRRVRGRRKRLLVALLGEEIGGSETFCGAALWGKERGKGSATAARATVGFWTVSAACGKIPLDFFSPSRGHGPFLDCSTTPGPVILDRKSFQKIKAKVYFTSSNYHQNLVFLLQL